MAAAANSNNNNSNNNNSNNNNTRFNNIYLIDDYDPNTFIGPNYTKINEIELIPPNRPNEFYASSFMIYNENNENNEIIIIIHKPKLSKYNESSLSIVLDIHPITIELLQSQYQYNTPNHMEKLKEFFTKLDAGKSIAIVFQKKPEQKLEYINELIKQCQDTIYKSKMIVNNSNNNTQTRKRTSTRLAKSSIPKRTKTKLQFNSPSNRRSRNNNNNSRKNVFISHSTVINLNNNNTVFYDQIAANQQIEDEQSGYMNVNPEEERFPPASYQTPTHSRRVANRSTSMMHPLPAFVIMGQLPNSEEFVLTPPRARAVPAAPAPVIAAEWTLTPTPATPTQPA
jgi:hypothetical protein